MEEINEETLNFVRSEGAKKKEVRKRIISMSQFIVFGHY